ncbi:hypothetical protein Tco_0647180 [Tanacetum coccineum]
METMNVQFDELTQMGFEQHGLGPDLHGLTSRHISSRLVLNQAASTSAKPPIMNDCDLLFQPMFYEYFKSPSAVSTPISAATLLLTDTAEATSSSSIVKDAPSPSTSPNIDAINSLINSTNVEPNKEVIEFDNSGCSKHMTGHRDKLINFVSKFIGTVRFGKDYFAAIMGYEDLKIGNILVSRVYYVEGLGHNLFFVGQFCDSDLEVAFRKHTCFVRNLEGVIYYRVLVVLIFMQSQWRI